MNYHDIPTVDIEKLLQEIRSVKLTNNDSIFHMLDLIGSYLPCLQCPEQIIKTAKYLKEQEIKSYLEIGFYCGGTFIFINEFIKNLESTAIDANIFNTYSILNRYSLFNNKIKVRKMNTSTKEFHDLIYNRNWDAVFIDGDHSYAGLKADFEAIKDRARIVVIHDIINPSTPDVTNFWNEIKYNYSYIE